MLELINNIHIPNVLDTPQIQQFISQLQANVYVYSLIQVVCIWFILVAIGELVSLISETFMKMMTVPFGRKGAFYICNYLTYIGTVHHELSHAIMATITGAKVTRIVLVPREKKLGSVEFKTSTNFILKSIQLVITSIAPVACGMVSLYIMITLIYGYCNEIWQVILFWYVFISIMIHMTLSKQDVSNIFRGLAVCMGLLYLILIVVQLNFGIIHI